MNGRLRFDLRPIQRCIKALAPQVTKSRRELAEEAARGFVMNLPPAGMQAHRSSA
jgi:hypothetical protein